jgi:hypothetical protein
MNIIMKSALTCIVLLTMHATIAKSIAVTFKHVPATNGYEPPSAFLYLSAVKNNGGHRTSPNYGLLRGASAKDTLYYTPLIAPDASGEYTLGLACAYINLPIAIPPAPPYSGTMARRGFVLKRKDTELVIEASCPLGADGRFYPSDIRIVSR